MQKERIWDNLSRVYTAEDTARRLNEARLRDLRFKEGLLTAGLAVALFAVSASCWFVYGSLVLCLM